MAVATELVYTEKELAAIEALRAANGPMSLKDLGVASGTMVSIIKKAQKFADKNPVIVLSEDVEDVCPTCGHKHAYKRYYLG